MKNEKEWKLRIMTDLAVEAAELLSAEETAEKTDEGDEFDGVTIDISEKETAAATVKTTWIEILNADGAKKMGKPIGNYITVESAAMKENEVEAHEEIIKILSEQLVKLKKLGDDALILVIGLGNWNVTPDALGPKVISKILVTRHIMDALPAELDCDLRPVSAVTPGVMGITGIETGEIVKGIVEKIKPDLVIAVDALAARHANRVNATVQLSDTGISPGAGMGNRRMAINEETLGVPVIAVGVPTVVDAATLVNDSLDQMLSSMISELPEDSAFFEMLNNLESEEKYTLIRNVLDPYAGNMFVAPKEVDAVIERLSNIIANAVNIALHPGITKEDINRYLY
ncbi:MAG: GPR endopeptidase [Clostridiales bacterium]|jgi:spore protease|nr:GPR endopeptidase [Clostridiales bacterium]